MAIICLRFSPLMIYRIYYKNRPALQMLIEDVKNRCVDRILVIDLEVFFGSAGDAAGIYDELKKIEGLELVDLPLILSLEKAEAKQRNELEMNMAFSVAYEAFIDKYRPRPKYKYYEKECLIYVFFTQGDIVGLNDKIAACTALAKPGSKIRYIIKITSSTSLAIIVATAAPFAPSSGKPNLPKIRR